MNSLKEKREIFLKCAIMIIILCIILLGIAIYLKNSNKSDYIEIKGDYEGEYTIQYIDYDTLMECEPNIQNGNFDEMLYQKSKVMNFKEYKTFCEKWNLDIKYSNEKINYIVYVDTIGEYLKARLSNVEYKDNTANIYVWKASGLGGVYALSGFAIIIPTEKNIENIEGIQTYTEEEIENLKKYNQTYNPKECVDKPIIYLYPTEETKVAVELRNQGNITCSYPQYANGWNVLAKPNGDLINLDNNRNLYSLYYESENVVNFKIENDGFIVKGNEVANFLEEKLVILGLNERETEEFIIYWLPKLENNKYNYIRFATMDEINENMPLEINPNPDTIIRVLMTFKGLENPIDVQEQQLETQTRTGFIAVEWGGTEIK